jgi:hypothetical protein
MPVNGGEKDARSGGGGFAGVGGSISLQNFSDQIILLLRQLYMTSLPHSSHRRKPVSRVILDAGSSPV